MPKGRRPRRVAQVRHTQRRLIERFGISLSAAEISSLADRITRGDNVTYVGPGYDKKAIYELEHEGMLLRLVYDRKRRTIVTVTPPPP
jgi:hypothetical protein